MNFLGKPVHINLRAICLYERDWDAPSTCSKPCGTQWHHACRVASIQLANSVNASSGCVSQQNVTLFTYRYFRVSKILNIFFIDFGLSGLCNLHLTQWPLGYVVVIIKMKYLNKLWIKFKNTCKIAPLNATYHNTWTFVDPDLFHGMASLSNNE